MPQQRLLAISELSLTAYRWRSGLLNLEREFAADASGLVQWDDYIRHNRHAIFSVFAALAEENLQAEEIPHVRGADRNALIERKLAQRFPGGNYKLSLLQGRGNSGRRDDKVLLAALNRPEILEPWLAMLRRADARLAGIYTAPLLAERLAGEIGNGEPRFLLTVLLRNGVQQMFFDHKHLRFSRCFAVDTRDREATAELCARESATVLGYLVAQRLLPADSVLPVVTLIHGDDAALFRSACQDQGALRYSFAELSSVSRKNGLRTPPESSLSESLFLHLMVRRPAAAQYAPPGIRRFYHLGRIQSLLVASTAAIVLASLLSTGRDLVELSRVDGERLLLADQAEKAASEYQVARTRLSPKHLDTAALRAVTDSLEALPREESNLARILVQISLALERSPGVELERLDWRQSEESAASGFRYQVDVHARLPLPTAADADAQASSVAGFAAALHSATDSPVETVQWPAAIDLQRRLGPDDVEQIGGDKPSFHLRFATTAR